MDLKNISAKWKWIAGIVVVLLIVLLFGKMHQNGGSVTVPKNVSFVKQAHGSGTHVWLMSTGQAKDSDVYYIIVLQNGKARTYRTYDDDTTLGKLSKMSDRQTISYAKKQDKKYFEASAKEAKLAKNNEHDGFNADLKSSINLPSYYKLVKDNKIIGTALDTGKVNDQDDPYLVTFNSQGKRTSSKDGVTELPNDVTKQYESVPESTDQNGSNHQILDNAYNGLIEHINETHYAAPKAVKVKATSKTDDSGNNIVSQRATVQYTSSTDSDEITSNFLSMAEKDPSIMKKLYDLQKGYEKAEENYDTGDGAQLQKDAETASREGFAKMFDKNFCYKLTKGVFGNYTEDYTINLDSTVDFDIYDAHYIGYFRGSKNGYLVTKAQNDKQTAVFAK